jgi:hypothetical protein
VPPPPLHPFTPKVRGRRLDLDGGVLTRKRAAAAGGEQWTAVPAAVKMAAVLAELMVDQPWVAEEEELDSDYESEEDNEGGEYGEDDLYGGDDGEDDEELEVGWGCGEGGGLERAAGWVEGVGPGQRRYGGGWFEDDGEV